MNIYTTSSVRNHAKSITQASTQTGYLPFSDVLSAQHVSQIIEPLEYRERIFTPSLTIFGFLSQVMGSDQSCQQAVAQVIAHQALHAAPLLPSANTAAYCKARTRLPEDLLSQLTKESGHALEQEVSADWLWRGRHIKLIDGTTVSMPDTPDNQSCYPQPSTQKKGSVFHSRVWWAFFR